MKTVHIRCGATVTNAMAIADPGCVSYVMDRIYTEAARALMQKIENRNDYIIRRNDKEEYNKYLCEKELTTTIQVAQLIRCKDCKHWREGTAFPYCDKLHGMGVLNPLDYMTAEDDYCSMAERKEQ